MAEKKSESTKRFGTRYGRKLKEKVAEAESGHRGRHKCPYCGKNNAKRIAAGIWTCTSCKVKFTGNAYSIGKSTSTKKEEEAIIEEKTEESEESDTEEEV